MKMIFRCFVIAVFCCGALVACTEEIDQTEREKVYEPAAIGQPIEFDFSFSKGGVQTRSTTPLPVDETVYVTPNQGTTYYRYRYDETEERWKCIETNPLTWTATEMKIWALVGNNGTGAPNITADQASNGYEESDFLGSFGKYTYTTGVVKMTLEHKVARLQVKVTGSLDPSILTCTTDATFPTSASITLGDNSLSLTAGTTVEKFKLYRSSYDKNNDDVTKNTTHFTAYMMPDDAFHTVFTIKCGTLTYTSSDITVALKAGQTSQVNITLPVIQQVWNYTIQNPGREDKGWVSSALDNSDKTSDIPNVGPIPTTSPNIGTAQEFVAPITGWYKLEVWGAEGGSYQYSKYGWTAYDLQMKGTSMCKGGTGAYVTGKLKLNKGDKLYVYVGKAGVQEIDSCAYNSAEGKYCLKYAGGWNGGGTSWMNTTVTGRTSRIQDAYAEAARTTGGGGGGGATDIALQSSTWESAAHLYSRIIVAGGGGGGCYTPDQPGWYDGGGGGGGSTWEGELGNGDSSCPGYGGTLTESLPAVGAGAAGSKNYCKFSYNGGFGFGGGAGWSGESTGGGGGGWYGGTSGTGSGTNSAGGGGSSYAYTEDLYYPGTNNTIASYYPTTYSKQTGYMPNTKYLLKDVSNLSGSYVQTVSKEDYPTTTIVGARNEAWWGHGHARITLLLE